MVTCDSRTLQQSAVEVIIHMHLLLTIANSLTSSYRCCLRRSSTML